MSRTQTFLILTALTVTSSLAACAHQAKTAAGPPAPPAAPPPAVAASQSAPPPAAPRAASCASDLGCPSSQLCVAGTCAAISPSMSACGPTRVHFDFDSDVLHPAEYPLLERMSRCIRANQPAHVLITGNADERGTVAYNLALGQRRAAAVRHYLGDLGVATSRLDLVSYGKELPVCREHEESCWEQNRRSGVRPGEGPQDVAAMVKADERREQAVTAK